jgi:hypothetical protein
MARPRFAVPSFKSAGSLTPGADKLFECTGACSVNAASPWTRMVVNPLTALSQLDTSAHRYGRALGDQGRLAAP